MDTIERPENDSYKFELSLEKLTQNYQITDRAEKNWMKQTTAVSILVFCTYIFLSLSLESSAYSKEIRVGVYNNKPLIFMTESGPQGIYVDVLESIAKAEGWNLRYRQGTWNDVFTLLTRNEIDILPVVAFTETRLAQMDFCDQTLISNWGQVYARKNLSMNSIQNLEGKKIASLSQDTHGDYFKTLLAQLGISYEAVLIENYQELFQALESGKTDAGVVNYLAARNTAENYDIQSTPIFFNPIEIRYAVPKGDPKDILASIDSHIISFKSDKNSVYHTSMAYWFGAESPSYQFPGWIKWVFIILSGVLIVLVAGNIILRIQVKAKTKALLIELKNRELAEKAVRKSENLARKMVANIADVIVIIDRNGINKYKSPNIEKLFGWNPEEIVGANTFDNVHPDDQESAQLYFEKLMQTPGAAGMIESRYRCKNGSFKWIEFKGVNLFHDPDIQGLLGNYHDITERKQAEQSLAESEARFKALHNASFGGIAIHDQGIIMECNQGLSGMTGYEYSELIGMDGLLLFAERSREAVMTNILTGFEKPYEAFGLRKNGEEFPIQLEARNVPYKGKHVRTVEFRDLTERKQAELEREELQLQLQQAQKMEAIGTLAGGIAHDFNNILGAILGYAEMAQEDSPPGSILRKDIDQIVKASHRARELIKQILAFSRQAKVEHIPLQPAFIIKEVIKLLRSSLPSSITIKQDIDMNTGPILASPTQFHQIVMNLCTNAFHAMENTGGTLAISLEKKTLNEKNIDDETGVQSGDFAQLLIGDTGPGIAPELLGKIFDPYFTTKEVGKGTGMGLAIIHGIVKSHGGVVSFESSPGKGSVFQVLLPIVAEETVVENKPEKTIQFGNERILFIDDEELLAEMSKNMLERLGYQVTVQSSSLEALAIFQDQPDKYDLVITDQTMPDMTGSELARRILQIRPFMPIILCTGYSSGISEVKAKLLGIKGFAMKPMAKENIAVLIREVLDETTAIVKA